MKKFIAMLAVRDEGDIIEEFFTSTLQWADLIVVYDTGSTDRTYEVIDYFAREYPERVKTMGTQSVYFNESQVRALLFNEARKFASSGDWLLRVDADEFYHISPPDFVSSFIKNWENTVYYQLFDFWFTTYDLSLWQTEIETVEDRRRPICERRRYYSIRKYTQPRMFRYRKSMKWPMATSQPYLSGPIAAERIPIRHYPNRDPMQMAARLNLRSVQMAYQEVNSCFEQSELHHWSTQREWRQLVRNPEDPDIRLMHSLSDIPTIKDYSHLPSKRRVFMKRVVDTVGLVNLFDYLKPGWTDDMVPKPMPETLTRKLSVQFDKKDYSDGG